MPIDLDDAVDLTLVGTRRIAMVGASSNPMRDSHGVMRVLLEAGYEVVPVNPTVDEVLGQRAYPDLASVPGRIDLVDVFRAEEHLPDVAREAVARDDVAIVWNQLGLRSDEARTVVREAGLGYVEDRCLKVDVLRRRATPPAAPRLVHDVVLVDLDGTVLDYETAEAAALAATLEELGLEADADHVAAYRRINAEHWAAFEREELSGQELRTARWEAFVAEQGLAADGRVAAVHYLERLTAAGDVLPGAAEALWWLGRRSRLVALTNGFDDVQRGRLAAAGVWEAFDGFVSSDAAGVAKPDPAIVEAALATIDAVGTDPSGLAIVGDSLTSDIAAGHAVGAHTVWIAPADAVVPEGTQPPDLHVTRLADLA